MHNFKNNPKVSIIVPVYNSEKTLAKCINSILLQSYKNYELIIVNNNSNDNTKKIIYFFMKKDSRIKYAFEKIKGRGIARNTGIKNVSGSIILMTDSDCIVPKNWIYNMIQPIIKENENIIMGSEYSLFNNFWTIEYQNLVYETYKKMFDGKYFKGVIRSKERLLK